MIPNVKNKETSKKFESLSIRLLKIVFSIYLGITLIITSIQMTNEYILAKDFVQEGFEVSQNISQEIIANALWTFDKPQLSATIQGILNQSNIVGIEVIDNSKILSSRKGQVLDENSKPILIENGKITQLNFISLFSHKFEIKYEDKPIGSVILYSSNRVIFNKVKITFLVYIINAVIKTSALWVLFIWAFNKFLTRQLNVFCEEMERINIDTHKDYQLNLDTFNTHELHRIEYFFNDLLKRIIESREENIRVHQELMDVQIKHAETLEEKVTTRTNELNNTLNIIKHDLAVARKIQLNTLLYPNSLIEELEIVPVYLPMSEVGGDFYAISKFNDFTYRIFMADATGHGVQAALITMAIKGIYDNIKNFDINVENIMSIFNNEFIEKYISLKSLLTCVILEIDVKNNFFNYVSAGHPAIVCLKEGSVEVFPKTGMMIGVKENLQYKSVQVKFIPGDRLFIFTDGIFEQFNSKEEEFGEEKLYSILNETKNLSIENSIERALAALNEFLEGQEKQDDITILGIGYSTLKNL